MYKATTQKLLFVFLLGVDLILFFGSLGDTGFMVLTIFLSLICVLMFFVKYEFQINEQTLLYRIQLFTFAIYVKQANAKDVQMIHFKRVSWNTRIAIVKLYKGWNMRIALFSPDAVFEELERYAERNNIAINKTKDYKILKKMA
ncbi:diguanylate cyclase [Lysinibacillus sp. NPDC097287]|uniref:diguanylate cyclase n=1 Tax=Lysinibacillus sp. NPDC097287 TaxID=3364144 RepID=UPI0037FECB52